MNAVTRNETCEARAAETTREDIFITPYVDVRETKDSYVIEAEMPGVNQAGLEVLLDGNQLTILGRRQWDDAGTQVYHRESRRRDFRRGFELEPAIDSANISARIENGVLTLQLPKAEAVKPKRIPVSG